MDCFMRILQSTVLCSNSCSMYIFFSVGIHLINTYICMYIRWVSAENIGVACLLHLIVIYLPGQAIEWVGRRTEANIFRWKLTQPKGKSLSYNIHLLDAWIDCRAC